jgi:hypothetical protein
MANRKLGKRPHLTVCWYERRETSASSYSDGGPIYKERLCFRYRFIHKKGSNRPKGYYHDGFGGYEDTVEVTWAWTEKLGHYACEIHARPSRLGTKAALKILPVMEKIGRSALTPEKLCEALEVMIVESVEDEGEAYYDYRPVRIVGEPAMLTLARAAL